MRKPDRIGFGTRLLSRALGQDAANSSAMDFAPGGLRYVTRFRLIDESPTGTEA